MFAPVVVYATSRGLCGARGETLWILKVIHRSRCQMALSFGLTESTGRGRTDSMTARQDSQRPWIDIERLLRAGPRATWIRPRVSLS